MATLVGLRFLPSSIHTEGGSGCFGGFDSYRARFIQKGERRLWRDFDSYRVRLTERVSIHTEGGVATLVLNSRKTLNPRISKQCALTISGPFGAPGKKNRIN